MLHLVRDPGLRAVHAHQIVTQGVMVEDALQVVVLQETRVGVEVEVALTVAVNHLQGAQRFVT